MPRRGSKPPPIKSRPTRPLQWHFRDNTRPAHPKTPNLGCFECTGRTFSRLHGDIETNTTTAHPQQGTTETAITSAPKKCTKNTHFPPAKAITVSIPHRHKQAKATMVSGHRATWPTGPGCGARGRRRGLAGQQADVPGHTSAHQSPLAWRAPEHQRRNKQPPRT